jgi:PhzF family phenazine biosynthesis protein
VTVLMLQVDAFTDRAFAGNPAAICVLEAPAPDAWMAAVAREMNLSETAFLLRQEGGWSLRWFTPAVEVDLCGHATLASAHAIWEEGLDTGDRLRFHTRSGILSARRADAGIALDFPTDPARPLPPPPGLLKALGVDAPSVSGAGRSRFDWLVQLPSARTVRELKPDVQRLLDVEARGVIVTAPADDGVHDFVSRWFGPRVGVAEDPVTGSAHCCLAPWWAEQLGRDVLLGYQASARGGSVRVRLREDRVELTGRAVTVLRGTLAAAALPAAWLELEPEQRRS